MGVERLYHGAMGLFGVAVTAQGVAAVDGASPGIGAWAVLLGGLSILCVTGAAFVSDDAHSPGRLGRVAVVASAVVFTAVTAAQFV